MLGKRNFRAGDFSTCHATVLVGFIVLAHVLGLGALGHKMQLSETESVKPSVPSHICLLQGDGSALMRSCAVLINVTHKGPTPSGIVVWGQGTRL